MQVLSATTCVAHTFEVVQSAKVAAVVCQGDIDPVRRSLVYRCSDTEPWSYLHLRGTVVVLLRLLVFPAALNLGSWGVPAVDGVVAYECQQGNAG